MKTRGYRNNNPGNIRNNERVDWLGEVDESKKNDATFEEFEDMAHGFRALIKLLQNYRKIHGCQTIADFIERWAPAHENNTAGYVCRVCKELQVPESYVPDIYDKSTMVHLACAIALVENGSPANIEDAEAGWNLL